MKLLTFLEFALISWSTAKFPSGGFGMTDGEGCERLLGNDKEMRPSHRLHILTDGIINYCQLSADRLGRWNYMHISWGQIRFTNIILLPHNISSHLLIPTRQHASSDMYDKIMSIECMSYFRFLRWRWWWHYGGIRKQQLENDEYM